MEAVVVEQNAGAGIDVRVRVLRLAVLLQNIGGNLRVLLHELEDRVLGDLWSRGGVVHEGLEAGIGLAQDGVAVAWHDSAGLERRPKVVRDVLVREAGPDVLLHLQDPSEDFLSGETIGTLVQVEKI